MESYKGTRATKFVRAERAWVWYQISKTIPCNIIKSVCSPSIDLDILRIAARPRWLPREISLLVNYGIYFPPRPPAQKTQRKHVMVNVLSLQVNCKNPFFVIMGNLNTFRDYELASALKFKQVVNYTCWKMPWTKL